MEQQQCLTNQNEDMLSDLPEVLLLHILSSLLTNELIATSVLSKRWRSLWKIVPNLNFDSTTYKVSSEDVYMSLILHISPFLESLHLYIDDTAGPFDIGILFAIAFSRHVRELGVYHFREDPEEAFRFPSVLCSYNNLSLDLPLTIKDPIFYQLVSLELFLNELNGLNLWFILESSPKLQILKLISTYCEPFPVDWEWNQPKCVPKCLLFHLETFVWTEYDWQREDEKQVATYILQNAGRLKKATFLLEEVEELGMRSEMINELASVVRASASCHLVF